MIGPHITPEQGIDGYERDYTQGPACAIACGAGTIYRNYFVKTGDQFGQTFDNQIDCLELIGQELENDKLALWSMKIWIVPLLIFVCYATGYTQDIRNRCGEVFNAKKYPADSFSIRKTAYPLGNTEIIFTQLHHDYFEEEAGLYQIWVEQRENGKVLKSEYWGFEEGENGYQLPIQQLIKDHFMVNRSREFTGTFYLISSTGMWHKIPGGEIYLDKGISILYTFVPVECGGCQIGRFDLKSKQLTTKVWDGHGIAWEELKDHSGLTNVFENGEWIKW